MAYRYRSRRATRKLARKSRRNFILTLIIVIVLIYATLNWVLPYFIGGVGALKNIIRPSQVVIPKSAQNASLAPPVLNIPYEATNSAHIDISGFGTPDSRVRLYIDNESVQIINVSLDGSFIFSNVTLRLGINNIYGATLDEQDKESLPSKTIKLIFDNEKPPLNISSPDDNTAITGGDKKITVSGKTNQGIQVFVNGGQVIVDKDGNFSTDIALSEGDNTISVRAADIASNSTGTERRVTYKP